MAADNGPDHGSEIRHLRELITIEKSQIRKELAYVLSLIEQRLGQADRTLIEQAREYERRLGELNHAHELAIEVSHTYLTITKFEEWVKSDNEQDRLIIGGLRTETQTNRDAIAGLADRMSATENKWAGVVLTGRFVAALLGIVIAVITIYGFTR